MIPGEAITVETSLDGSAMQYTPEVEAARPLEGVT
jgi:hypothetical protein